MEKVADAFRTIAHQTQCSIDLLHHSMKTQSRKASSLAGDQYLGRGASAMIGAVRFAYTVTLVPEKDAEKLGIPTEFKKRGMRIDQANYAPHDDGATVFLMRSVKLMNGDEINMDGDSVGVPDLLKHAGPATTRLSQAKKVLDAIAGVFKRDTVTLKEILPAVKAAINCEDRTARKLIAEALPIEKSVFVSCGGIPYKFQRLRHKGKFVVNRTRVETSDASGIDA
jgi:hypothetical protein